MVFRAPGREKQVFYVVSGALGSQAVKARIFSGLKGSLALKLRILRGLGGFQALKTTYFVWFSVHPGPKMKPKWSQNGSLEAWGAGAGF